jgi:PAS domain S-box-containing protein
MMSDNSLHVYSALDYAHTGMCVVDNEYNVIFWNKRLVEWTLITKEKIACKNITLFCPALKEKRNTIRLNEIFKGGPPVIFSSQIHKHLFPAPLANGEFRIQHVTVSAIPSQDGTHHHALFAVEDVTELTLRMSELDKARHEAEAANRSKSDFLANMSHEIRTPMNGILGMCHILMTSGLTEDQINYACMIDRSAKTLLNIINDILDFSKIEAGKMNLIPIPFDLRRIVEDVVQMLSFASEKKGLRLFFEYPEAIERFFIADDGRVRQILINIVNNAVKFTEKGSVSIHVSSTPSDNGTELINLIVKDTGIGIAEEIQPILFKKFNQVDSSSTRKFQGTGLGLAISRQFTRLMGGEITLKSQLGCGSEFTIQLQLPKANPDQIKQLIDVENNPIPFEGKTESFDVRVLLAEDNQINQAVASHILEQLHCQVEVVENGQEAVDILQLKHFDIVFMDCQMPVLDGYSATRTIRDFEQSINQHIPIIAMTAHAIEGDREKCIDSGMDDYISKPIDIHKLLLIMKKYCSHRKKHYSVMVQPSVLIADDDMVTLTELEQTITNLFPNSTIKKASDGVEACMLLGNIRPDIFICDILIPNMDGEAVISYMRRNIQFEKTKIIVITALPGTDPTVNRVQRMGVTEVVFKPIENVKFNEILLNAVKSKNSEPHIDLNDPILPSELSIDYRGLVESSLHGIGIFQNNKFTFSNASLSKIFNKTVDSILNVNISDLYANVVETDITKLEKLLKTKSTKQSTTERDIIQFKSTHHDSVFIDMYSCIIQHKNNIARLVLTTDVSDWMNNKNHNFSNKIVSNDKQLVPKIINQRTEQPKITLHDIPDSIVAVDDLIERLGADEQFATELLIKFSETLPNELNTLQTALDKHECSKIEITAHRIKGAARNLSICGLMETMDVIEHAGRALNITTISEVFSEAKSQADAFISIIKKLPSP